MTAPSSSRTEEVQETAMKSMTSFRRLGLSKNAGLDDHQSVFIHFSYIFVLFIYTTVSFGHLVRKKQDLDEIRGDHSRDEYMLFQQRAA